MRENKIIAIILIAVSLLSLLFLTATHFDQKKIRENKNLSTSYKTASSSKETINNKNFSLTERARGDNELVNIEKIIGEFYFYINSKDYEKAFEMLNEDYIDFYELSLEHFKGKHDYKDEKIYSIRSTQIEPDRYIIGVDLINRADLESGNKGSLSRITLGYIKDKGLDEVGIKWSINSKTLKEEKDFDIGIIKEIGINDGIVYEIKINNKSDKAIRIKNEPEGIYASNNNRTFNHFLIIDYPKQYQISPGEEKVLKIFFRHAKEIREIKMITEDEKEITIVIR